MGIINVTPDSFSDGGRFFESEVAVAAGVQMVQDGADFLDVGGESTRPGSDPVSVDEEIDRVVRVIKRLAAEVETPISVDTRKHEVTLAAVDAGAAIVNDVTAGSDPRVFDVVRDAGAAMVLMHMRDEPKTMQQSRTTRTSWPRSGTIWRSVWRLRQPGGSTVTAWPSIRASASPRPRKRTTS